MAPFNYHHVDQELIDKLHEKLLTEKSIVLLGPRYGGKRYVMDRLQALLEASGIEPVIRLRLRSEVPICTTAALGQMIREAVILSDGKRESLYPVSDDPFEPLKTLIHRKKKAAMLMAANVDGMSHHLARRFLQEARTLVEAKQLVAVISGESDLRELVNGENSDFSCAEHYVLQGYAKEEFSEFLTTELKYLSLKFANPHEAYQHLWATTGGNFYLLRVLLWSIIQERARSKISPRPHVLIDEIPSALKLTRIPGAYGAHIFHHAAQSIAREAHCWQELQELMQGKRVAVQAHAAPSRLELAGIATRRIAEGDAELQFSSPVMKAFVDGFYDPRRFGDLYASIGAWDEAFERYGQLAPEERVRPMSTDDRSELESTIAAFCSSLYAEVAGQEKNDSGIVHVEGVSRLFAQGCHYILGFREITFWQRDTSQQPPIWRPHPPSPFISDSTNSLSCIEQLLPPSWERNLKVGIDESERSSKYGVVAVLPSKINMQLIVVVSDFAGSGVVSHERRIFIKQILNNFIGAYRHALEVVNLQVRHRIRQRHDTIIDSLFEYLTEPDFDLKALLWKAARGLKQLHYKRVLFSMVNKERTAIVGVVDDSDNPNVDVAAMTNWPLKKAVADLQPYVIKTKRAKIVKDARNEPLANKKAVQSAGMEALAIAPILNSKGHAIGTIHVERTDGAVPTRTEVDDLVFFGRQLAIVIEQLEHLIIEKGTYLQQAHVTSLPAHATDTDSSIAAMLEVMARLGHRWGRMYLLEDVDGDSFFVSKKWLGLTVPGSDAEEDFNKGKVRLAARSSGHPDWRCIEDGQPIVYCWHENLADAEKFISPGGLEVFNWKNPAQPRQIKKEPGDYWIDFPLIHHRQPLGKMCLQLDENVGKRHLELLEVLSANFSAILAANLQRDRDSQTHEQLIRKSVLDHTIATVAHNLGTRLGSLPVILDRYRFRTKKYGYKEIEELNDRLQKIIYSAQTAAKRFSLISEVIPQLRPVNISAYLIEMLAQNLPDNTWKFCGSVPPPILELDANLFETALLELVQNSRDAASTPDNLHISITLETILAKEEDSVTIFYRDNGPGVPDEYRELIFDDFFSHRPKQKLPGTGLGMGFARRVIEAHGGNILYTGQKEPGDPPGAEFTITLPWTGQHELTEENEDVQNPNSRG